MNTQLDEKTKRPSENGKTEAFLKKPWKQTRRDLGWKILALVLAVVMWAGLISQDSSLVREKTFVDVPVSITGAETLQRYGYIVTSDLDKDPITVRMKVDVPQLEYNAVTSSNYNPRIELNRIRSAGKQTVNIATTSTSSFGAVTEIVPSTVELTVEEYVTRYRIPLTIAQTGELPEGYFLDNVRLDPTMVAVSGPKSLVNKVNRAAVTLDKSLLPAQEGASAMALPLKLMDSKGREIASSQVSVTSESVLLDSIVVSYEMYPTQQITLSGIGMTQGEPAEGYEVKKVTVSPNTIRLAAPEETLQALDLETLFLDQAVKLEGKTESFTQSVKVRKPSGAADLSPESVTVAVEIGPVITEREFTNLKVSLTDVPEGFKAQADGQRATVKVNGPLLWLNKIKNSQITLWADLSDLEAGEHQVPIQCEIADAEGVSYVFKMEPAQVNVTLTAK